MKWMNDKLKSFGWHYAECYECGKKINTKEGYFHCQDTFCGISYHTKCCQKQEKEKPISSTIPQYYKDNFNKNSKVLNNGSFMNEKILKRCHCIWVNPNIDEIDM